jgi:hypothetical protein
MTAPDHAHPLVLVLDYSGTLSPGAVLFGRDATLAAALRTSGLADLGLAAPARFWAEVVDPTWEQAGTGALSYHDCVEQAVQRIDPAADPAAARQAAARFTAAYYLAGHVAGAWRDLLRAVVASPATRVVVATDNYREATGSLEGDLGLLGVRARRLGKGPADRELMVANSADLGCFKVTAEFWRQVRRGLGGRTAHRVLVADDFGANELAADHYSATERILPRRRRTEALLGEVFGAPVESWPCVLPLAQAREPGDVAPQLAAYVDRLHARLEVILRGEAGDEPGGDGDHAPQGDPEGGTDPHGGRGPDG